MSPAMTVLLPTPRRSPVIEEIATQLSPADELLVICDHGTDPVADYDDEFENVRVVVAGELTDCSDKANAIATGMEEATHDGSSGLTTICITLRIGCQHSTRHTMKGALSPNSTFSSAATHFPPCWNRYTLSEAHSGHTQPTRHGEGRSCSNGTT